MISKRYKNTRVLQRRIEAGDGKYISDLACKRKQKIFKKYYLWS